MGLSLDQLASPEYLSSYDTGVYLAATMHFIAGAVPYRNLTFVPPPGIVLLMTPAAVFSRLFGTHDALELVRILGALVTALNVSLLAWMVRRRGLVAMVIAGAGLALAPVAFWVSSSLTLEPYCVFFALMGATLVFSSDDKEATRWRLAIVGVLFGISGAIKLWAIFPFIALIVCLAPRYKWRVVSLVKGAATSFALICVPFFILAPMNFFSEVFSEQLLRKAPPYQSASILSRLIVLTGYQPTTSSPTKLEALIAFAGLVLIVALTFRRHLENSSPDYFLLVTAVITFVALLTTREFFYYYGYFCAPFLWGVAGISLARLIDPLRERISRLSVRASLRRMYSFVLATVAVVFLFAMILYISSYYSVYAWANGLYGPWIEQIATYVPPGSCVVYSEVSYGVDANRFYTTDPNCPIVVDPYGMWMKFGYKAVPPTQTFADQWKQYFKDAQYVVLSGPNDPNVPGPISLRSYFENHFRHIFGKC